MKEDNRWQISFSQLGNALQRLGEVLREPLDKNDYVLDATIQRFEFCVELYWKTLKHLLAKEGVNVVLPKECLQKAYAAGWISNEVLWISMMRTRNLTSHTYKHEVAIRTYEEIKIFYPEMQSVYKSLKEKFL